MNGDHRTPQSAPRPLCSAFEPLLPLASLSKLDPGEAAQVAAHVATCDSCRRLMAEFDVLRDALRREVALDSEADAEPQMLSLDAVLRVADQDRPAPAPRPAQPIGDGSHRRSGRSNALTVLAAVLLIALFAGLEVHHRLAGTTPSPSPVATVDPATQAYVGMLRTYYPPFADAEQREWDQCAVSIRFNAPPQLLAPCRPVEQAAVSAAQALLDHLAMTPPPVRWQAQDTKLKQALQAAIAYNLERIQDIDAHNVLQFYLTRDQGDVAASLLCTTLTQIDDGPPPLVPGFPPPDYALNPTHSGCL